MLSYYKMAQYIFCSKNGILDNMFDLTDNIFAIKKWCRLKFNIDMKTLDQQFGIPSDLDYLE